MLDFFKEFFDQGLFERSLNVTFFCLNPKKISTKDLKDFGPISLVRSLYKLLVNVLANSKLLVNIFSSFQNVLVERRQICDEILIDNEIIDSRLKSGSNGINLCKLDI